MFDHRGVGDRSVTAPVRGRDLGVAPREAAHMGLVNDGVVPRRPGLVVVSPLEGCVDDYRLRHRAGGIGVVYGPVVRRPWPRAVDGGAPDDLTCNRLGVRVEQELGMVGPKPSGGVVGTADPVAVKLAR